MTRQVTLQLTDGTILPSFEVGLPWWQEAREVVAAARQHLGIDVSILRILETEPGARSGGRVKYLAETGDSTLSTDDGHPLRPDYARSGGPARSIAWARSVLECPIIAVTQERTWNLSAIWRLDTPEAPVWLKHVPWFFAHEATVLRWLGKPVLLAADDTGRMLLKDIPGDDLYGAGLEVCQEIASDMVAIQLRALESGPPLGVPSMLELPAPPWLAARWAVVNACGLPDTLVHGDLHPGNVRGTPEQRTIIDWGDAFVGHPGFDILRLSEGLDQAGAASLIEHWARLWKAAIPGCDPLAAVEALRPIWALRNAAVFAHFLANIEPAEHPYHAEDVTHWLAVAVAAAQASS